MADRSLVITAPFKKHANFRFLFDFWAKVSSKKGAKNNRNRGQPLSAYGIRMSVINFLYLDNQREHSLCLHASMAYCKNTFLNPGYYFIWQEMPRHHPSIWVIFEFLAHFLGHLYNSYSIVHL